MTALLAVACAGAWSYARSFQVGLGVTGLSRDIPWGLYIAQFTFLVASPLGGDGLLPYYLHDYRLFGRLTILGEFPGDQRGGHVRPLHRRRHGQPSAC